MMRAVPAGDDASVLRHIDHRINQDALPVACGRRSWAAKASLLQHSRLAAFTMIQFIDS